MLCARVFVITMPELEDADQTLRFEKMLEYRFMGSAEMLSISNNIVSLYTYKHGKDSPELLLWDWATGRRAEHSIPWEVLRDVSVLIRCHDIRRLTSLRTAATRGTPRSTPLLRPSFS